MTYLTKRNTSSSSCRCNVLIVNLDTLTTFTSTETTLLNTSSIQSSKPYLDAFMDSLIHLLTKLFDVQRNPSLLSLIKDPWEINTALIVMYGMLPTHCFHSLIHGGGSSLSKKLHAFYHLHQGKILALGPVQLQTSLFSSLLSFNPIHKEYNEDQVHRSSSSETRNSHLELQSPTLHASSNETSFLHFHVPSETETETETMESTFFNQLEGQQLFGYPIHSLLDSSSTEDVFRMEAIKQHTHAWATYASFPQQSALLEFKPSLNPSSPQGQCIFSNVLIHTSHQQRSFLHWLCHDRFRLLSSVSSSKDALVTTPSTTTTTTQPPLLLLSSQPEQLTSFLQEQLSKISDLHVESNSFSSTTYSFQDSGSTFCFHFNSISTTPLFSSLLPSTSSSSSPPPSNTTYHIYVHPPPSSYTTHFPSDAFLHVPQYMDLLTRASSLSHPSFLKNYGDPLLYTPWTTSTQRVLDTHPRFTRCLPSGTVFWTEHQTHGRGRRSNQWVSPHGGFLITLVLNDVPSHVCSLLQYVLAVAVAKVLPLRIKWPNDLVMWQEAHATWVKLGGILVTSSSSSSSSSLLNVRLGLGINLTNTYPTMALSDFMTVPPTHVLGHDVLNHFQKYVKDYLARPATFFNHFHPQYLKYWIHGSTVVEVEGVGKGKMKGLSPEGELVLTSLDASPTSFTVQPNGNGFDLMHNMIVSKKDVT